MPYLPREFVRTNPDCLLKKQLYAHRYKSYTRRHSIDNRSPRALANEYVNHISKSFKLVNNLTVQNLKIHYFQKYCMGHSEIDLNCL